MKQCRLGRLVLLAAALFLTANMGLATAWATTVTASPTIVLCGVASGIRAYIGVPQCGGGTSHTIQFTVSGPGSVYPTTQETDPSGEADTVFTASQNSTGTATITARDLDNPNDTGATCSVRVFKVTVSDNPIWWFNGATPANYEVKTTLTASGPSGTYVWTVVSQTGIVGLGPSLATTYTGSPVDATSKGYSTNSAGITVSWNSNQVTQVSLQVKSPVTLQRAGIVHQANGVGYRSLVYYSIRDQFGSILPASVPVREHFVAGTDTSDYSEENWPWGNEVGVDVTPVFYDDIAVSDSSFSPAPQNPQSGTTAIDHLEQEWRVGTTSYPGGIWVFTDKLQRCQDHGDHLSWP